MEYIRSEVNSLGALNAELEKIETALDSKVSTEASGPRVMHADLDMNSNDILNLPAPSSPTSPVRKQDLDAALQETTGADLTLRGDLAAPNSTTLVGGVEAGDVYAVFDTLSSAASASLPLDKTIYIREREAGKSGGSVWLVATTSSANGIDKVVMSDNSKMLQLVVYDALNLDAVGLGNGSGNDHAILSRAGVIHTKLIGNPAKTAILTGQTVSFLNDVFISNLNTYEGTILFRKDAETNHCWFNRTFIRHRSANDLDYVSTSAYRSRFTANSNVSDNISVNGGLGIKYDKCTFDGNSYRHLKLLPLFGDATTTGASLTSNVRFVSCDFLGTAVRQVIDGYSGTSDVVVSDCKVDVQAEMFFEHKLKGDVATPYQTKHTNFRFRGNVINISGAACVGVYLFQGAYGAVGTSQTTQQSVSIENDDITATIINSFNAPIDIRGFNNVRINATVKHGNSNAHPSIQVGSNEYVKIDGSFCKAHISADAVSYSSQPSSPGYTLLGKELIVDGVILYDYKGQGGVLSDTFDCVRVVNSSLNTSLSSGTSSVKITNATKAVVCTGNTATGGAAAVNRLNLTGTPSLIVNRDNTWSLPIRTGDSSYTYTGESFYNSTTSKWNIKTSGGLKNYDGTTA